MTKHQNAQKFSYERDIIDAMMSRSEAQGIDKTTDTSKQDESQRTAYHISNDSSMIPGTTDTDLTNENEVKGRLLAQQSGLVQVMSSRLVTMCMY